MNYYSIFVSLICLANCSCVEAEDLSNVFNVNGLNIVVSDFFENLPRKNEDICLKKNQPLTSSSEQTIQIPSKPKFVFLERQPTNLLVGMYSELSGEVVRNIELFSSHDELIAEIFMLLDVSQADEHGNALGQLYSDVLSPISLINSDICSKGGLRILVDIEEERLSLGKHEYLLVISTDTKKIRLDIVIELKSLKADIFYDEIIKTDFFNVSDSSLAHFYKKDISSEGWQYRYDEANMLLKRSGINKAKVFRDMNASLDKLPIVLAGSKTTLQFTNSRELRLYCPNSLINVDIGLSFKWNEGKVTLLRNRLGNLRSGYLVSVNKFGELSIDAFTMEKQPVRLQAKLEPNKRYDLVISVTANTWRLYLNGELVDESDLDDRLLPASGASCVIGPGRVDVSSLTIEHKGIETNQEEFSVNLIKSLESIKKNINNKDLNIKTELIGQDIRSRYSKDVDQILLDIDLVDSFNSGEERYVSLPHDESYSGEKLRKNIEFGRALKEYSSSLKTIHTFGSMRSIRSLTASSRLKKLTVFRDVVDIWSIRYSLFLEQNRFFRNIVDSGGEISLYLHDVDSLEHQNSVANIRYFFNKLSQFNIRRVSYWNVNLWFHSGRSGRPSRHTSISNSVYYVTKRNPSGIGSGTLVWPSMNGVLPSLRLYAIEAGLFDANLAIAIKNSLETNTGVTSKRITAMSKMLNDWYDQSEGVKLEGGDSKSNILTMRIINQHMIEFASAN